MFLNVKKRSLGLLLLATLGIGISIGILGTMALNSPINSSGSFSLTGAKTLPASAANPNPGTPASPMHAISATPAPPTPQSPSAGPPFDAASENDGVSKASVNIVAVTTDGQGVTSKATVEIRAGEGRVLFNVNPFTEPDTQQSVKTARDIAAQITGNDLSNVDAIYTVDDSPSQLVGGPSAGAAFTLATIAALESKSIRPDVALTGTIEEDGSIGPIGGVVEKGDAVGAAGYKTFLVPKGQKNLTYYEQQVTRTARGPLVYQQVDYVPKSLDLDQYLFDKYGTHVIEVATIQDVIKNALR